MDDLPFPKREKEEKDYFGKPIHQFQWGLAEDPRVYLGKLPPSAANASPFVTVTGQSYFDAYWISTFTAGETKMSSLKRRFKEKLEHAKELRETAGAPATIGKGIIEITEEEADKKLSDIKGYKYVSKKS